MKKRFSTLLIAAALGMSAVMLASCGNKPAPHVHGDPDEHDFCPDCGAYLGSETELNTNLYLSLEQGKTKFYRVPLTEDTEYGLWTALNPEYPNEVTVTAYVKPANAELPKVLVVAGDYEQRLLHAGVKNVDNDGYIYLEISYSGPAEHLDLEFLAVKTLNYKVDDDNVVPGFDRNLWYYGISVSDFSDSFDLETATYGINGKLVFGIDLGGADPSECKFKVDIDGLTGADSYMVWQENSSHHLVNPPTEGQYYLPVSGEVLVVVVDTEKAGSTLDAFITKAAR